METATKEKLLLTLKPNYDFILVRRIEEEDQGTIVKPEAYRQKSDKAVVIAVGPGRVLAGQIFPIEYEPGHIVAVSKHGGTDIELNGEEFTLLRVGDVYGRVYENGEN
jgi:chaperonin GroES